MPSTGWTPRIVPFGADQTVYLVIDRFGKLGSVYRETEVERVPWGERWLHEIKFDGYRVQVQLRDAAVKVFTRRGNDWTNRFRKIAADACHMNAGSAIIDGEVIVPSANGVSEFSVLQNEL